MRALGSSLTYASVAIVAFVASSIAMLPASVAASALASATRGEVQLVATSGRAWDGRGDLVFKAGNPSVVRDCRWIMQMDRLLAGELALKLSFPGPDVAGELSVARSWSSLSLRDARLVAPASVLAERIPQLRGWGASGTLELSSRSIELRNGNVAGEAQLLWRDAAASNLTPLGDYRVELNGTGNGPAQLRLVTLRGALQLKGSGELGGRAGFRLSGSARYTGSDQARIGTLLSTLGQPAADGSVPFNIAVPINLGT